MKSPAQLAQQLTRQWRQNALRERRLLPPNEWPLRFSIGLPEPGLLAQNTPLLAQHLQRWRAVSVGVVEWKTRRFRDASEPLELPRQWRIDSPAQWVAATGEPGVQQEYARLTRLISDAEPQFHRWLVRQHTALLEKSEDEIRQALRLALLLSPGCARGMPLRAVALAGVDSKFFERHRRLLVQLLDLRFDNQASALGLEMFLNASDERDHWLLVAPLAPGLLPFVRLRVRASELLNVALPGSHILIVENERCLHQLPLLPDSIAILGSGLDLEWLRAAWLSTKRIAYWGDMDTWGLKMLARARGFQPALQALLMRREIFESLRSAAVAEPAPCAEQVPPELSAGERDFFRYLSGLERGRLEQEFLPRELVTDELLRWRATRSV